MAKDIVDHLGLEKVTPPLRAALEANPNVFDQDFLPQVYQALNGRNLVLLLDEFDVLSDYRGDASVTAFFPICTRSFTARSLFYRAGGRAAAGRAADFAQFIP